MKTLLVAASITLFAIVATTQAQNAPFTVPVPKATGPIPATATSHALMAASVNEPPIDLAAKGYVEEEFFVSGTGNVYDWEADGSLKIRSSGLPYTSRILVRRPSNSR
jgi:hypothetical protein